MDTFNLLLPPRNYITPPTFYLHQKEHAQKCQIHLYPLQRRLENAHDCPLKQNHRARSLTPRLYFLRHHRLKELILVRRQPLCRHLVTRVEQLSNVYALDTNSSAEQDAQPRARLTAQEKLNLVVDTSWATNWTFEDFIRAWVGTQDHHLDVRLRHRRYGKVQARRAAMKAVMDEMDSRKQGLS